MCQILFSLSKLLQNTGESLSVSTYIFQKPRYWSQFKWKRTQVQKFKFNERLKQFSKETCPFPMGLAAAGHCCGQEQAPAVKTTFLWFMHLWNLFIKALRCIKQAYKIPWFSAWKSLQQKLFPVNSQFHSYLWERWQCICLQSTCSSSQGAISTSAPEAPVFLPIINRTISLPWKCFSHNSFFFKT